MKAVVCKAKNQVAVAEVPKPEAGAGQVVLRVRACGICGSDLHALEYGFAEQSDIGTRYSLSSIGNVMGHEFCGEVAQVGAGVDGVQARRPRDLAALSELWRMPSLPRWPPHAMRAVPRYRLGRHAGCIRRICPLRRRATWSSFPRR